MLLLHFYEGFVFNTLFSRSRSFNTVEISNFCNGPCAWEDSLYLLTRNRTFAAKSEKSSLFDFERISFNSDICSIYAARTISLSCCLRRLFEITSWSTCFRRSSRLMGSSLILICNSDGIWILFDVWIQIWSEGHKNSQYDQHGYWRRQSQLKSFLRQSCLENWRRQSRRPDNGWSTCVLFPIALNGIK